MDLVGEFRKMEVDGKLCLVYHNVVKPLPQTHTSNSSDATIAIDPVDLDDLPHQPLFSCPASRIKSIQTSLDETWDLISSKVFYKFTTSPFFDDTSADGHHVLPLSWCNNKEDLDENECNMPRVHKVGTDYYLCLENNGDYDGNNGLHEKEAVQAPLEVNYPFHVNHSFQLYFSHGRGDFCIFCRKRVVYMVYYCAPCDIYMHVLCVQATIPFFIDQPKKHEHTLTLFPRQASLVCNVCALVNDFHLTYICAVCDFVVHRDCLNIPQTIRNSRHHHRISFISSVPFKEGSCGVCRKKVDSQYGAYTCNVCTSYAVHTRCALRPDICDGIELEGVPEEEDEDVEPFKVIADGVILHFSHGHHLKFEMSELYDENKFCQACALPIYRGNVYACVECDFLLHETCAEAPRKKVHPLHRHPLKLEVVPRGDGFCWACWNWCNGFIYVCTHKYCNFQLDIRCGLVSEPFEYGGHQHPLFLTLEPKEKPMCHVCKFTFEESKLKCIECDFVICFQCATLPYMVRYKHDEHDLTFCLGDEVDDSDWCELCEQKLSIEGGLGFYKCEDCSNTLHRDCLLGEDRYLKPGQTLEDDEYGETQVIRNSSSTRPTCYHCGSYCQFRIYLECGGYVFCSLNCIRSNGGKEINSTAIQSEDDESEGGEREDDESEGGECEDDEGEDDECEDDESEGDECEDDESEGDECEDDESEGDECEDDESERGECEDDECEDDESEGDECEDDECKGGECEDGESEGDESEDDDEA